MTNEKQFAEHFKKGRPTAYDESKHIPLLYTIFAGGESIYAYCDEALVTRPTFYNWVKAHEKFKEAYDIALCIGARKFEKYPETAINFDFRHWSTVMKNRYQYFKTPKMFLSDKRQPPLEILNSIFIALREGEITVQEASQLASVAVTQANIENSIPGDNQNSIRARTTEELKERLDIVNRLIEHQAEG